MDDDALDPHPWLASLLRPVCEGNTEDAEAGWNRLHRGLRFARAVLGPGFGEFSPPDDADDVMTVAYRYFPEMPLIEEN